MKTGAAFGAAVLFVVLATANAGGYRFGISDQAFYLPAVERQLNPGLFPHDAAVLATQSSLVATDEVLAAFTRVTGLSLPTGFFALYLVTMGILLIGAVALARALGFSWWTTAVFLALLTLRHHIDKTAANTLEGYMHPRMLAFGLGLLAMAAMLRGRVVWMALAILAGGLIHPTTTLWFVVVIAVAIPVARPAWRRPAAIVAAVGALVGVWAVFAGPFAGRLVPMDAAWLRVLADREFLFADTWPLSAWCANLGYAAVIALAYRYRLVRGLATGAEHALVAGWLALVVVFLITLPLVWMRLALAVELQINRVFWLLDVAATAYLAFWLTTGPLGTPRRRAAILGLVLALSAARGLWVLQVETKRPLVEVGLPHTPWMDAMNWLRARREPWFVLADPGHAWKYGVSVRVGAAKDTLLEGSKDPAIALYGRDLALRVADREAALADFETMTTSGAKELADRYGLDVLIADRARAFDLPVLYQNAQFVIYDLR